MGMCGQEARLSQALSFGERRLRQAGQDHRRVLHCYQLSLVHD